MILCTGNSARGQMAEGLLRELGVGKVEIESTGPASSFVRLEAIQVIAEIGIDISDDCSRAADEFVG